MSKGGSMVSHLKELLKQIAKRDKERVMNTIKGDAYERLIRLGYGKAKQRGERDGNNSHAFLGGMWSETCSSLGYQERIMSRCLPYSVDDDIMYIGGLINRSASVAAISGSLNWPVPEPYLTLVRSQESEEQEIKEIGEGCVDLVQAHFEASRKIPKTLIFFRYWVTKETLENELRSLKNSLQEREYNPKIISVLVYKQNRLLVSLDKMDTWPIDDPRPIESPGVFYKFKIVGATASGVTSLLVKSPPLK